MTREMSYPCDSDHGRKFMVDLLNEDAESWARLSGLLAVLALPPIRDELGNYRRRVVEVEVKPRSDQWVPIDGIVLEPGRMICWWGSNGTRVQYPFSRGEPVPRWRFADQGPKRPAVFIGDGT